MTSFCATCGSRPASELLCEQCGLDPRVPKEIVLAQANAFTQSAGVDIAYPGETTVLAVAISVAVVLTVMLSLVSFGLATALILFALLQLQLGERQLRKAALRVSDSNYPAIANLSRLAAFRLGVPVPDVYVQADNTPNAYTAGFLGQHWLVLTTPLLDLMEPDELLFVIGHELGHIRREHVSWMVLTSPQGGITFAPIRLVLNLVFAQWRHRAEFAADRAGLLACRSTDAAARALVRATYWTIPADISALDEHIRNDPTSALSELLDDHPALARRLRQIRDFAHLAAKKGQL